jgi:DNA-binding GntR family transcriptional regulator
MPVEYAVTVTDRTNERLESRRLAKLLRSQIEQGKYPPGAKMPSYRQLAAEHGFARNTIGAALKLLEEEGLVGIRPASGVFVLDPSAVPPERNLRAELKQLREQLRRARQDLVTAEQTVAGLLERLPGDEPRE